MRKPARSLCVTIAIMIGLLASTGCGYNDLQGLDEDTKAAWSEVVNQYQRRADFIPNLVNTVKGYAAHERETLESVVQARAKATGIQVTPEMLRDPAAFEQFQKRNNRCLQPWADSLPSRKTIRT